jgi:S1-C subfamily serine protease
MYGFAQGNSGRRAELEFIARDDKCDLAVLRATKPFGPTSTLSVGEPRLGSQVLLWGVPRDSTAATKAEIINFYSVADISPPKIQFERGDCQLIELSTFVAPGMSGGPVFEENGSLVGLATSSFDQMYSGFAVSGREILRFLQSVSLK